MTMMTATMGVVVTAAEDMMRGRYIMKAVARDIEALVLAGEERAEVLVRETGALSGKEVKKGVQRLSSGIEKRKKLNVRQRLRLAMKTMTTTITTRLLRMKRIMVSNNQYINIRRNMVINQLIAWFVFYILSAGVASKKFTYWHKP